MPLNPWRLDLLSKLERLGTVRAVAEAARLSPSSVSQQLAALEAETRTQLLVRVGRRVRITPAGLLLVGHARTILDRMETAQLELDGVMSEPVGLVRLAAFASAMPSIVLPAAAELHRAHPALQLEIHELEPDRIVPALQRGDLDLAVTSYPPDAAPPVDPALLVTPLTSDQVVLVAGEGIAVPDHTDPEAAVDVAGLAELPWALDVPGSLMSDLTLKICRDAGFEPRVVGYFPSHAVLLRHVEANLSVALLPALAVDERYRVRAIPLARPVSRSVMVIRRQAAAPRAAVRAVFEVLAGLAPVLPDKQPGKLPGGPAARGRPQRSTTTPPA